MYHRLAGRHELKIAPANQGGDIAGGSAIDRPAFHMAITCPLPNATN
jgi:hypothetical protein